MNDYEENTGDNNKSLCVGLDIGSTTAKIVVMGDNREILYKDYKRHNSRQPEMVREYLSEAFTKFPDHVFEVYITGSGGRSIAPYINARYIQEVSAVSHAVESLYPDIGSVIELGGQDSKVIIWKQDDQGRKMTLTFMNDKCAGGTGATIDKIFGKVGITPEEAAAVRLSSKTIHPVAAKCGVFAETDVVGLLKASVDREEIIASLCIAIAKQNLEVLVKGNILRDRVMLLGGPHTFLPVMVEAWRRVIPDTWELHKWKPESLPLEELIFVPDNAQYFAAIGAVLYGKDSETLVNSVNKGEQDRKYLSDLSGIERYISKGRIEKLSSYGKINDGLIESESELKEFKSKYSIPVFSPPDLEGVSELPVYIGIDGGSTSSKLVILDKDKNLVYKDYTLSEGNPIVDVRGMFRNMRKWAEDRGIEFDVRGTAVTGYASEILKKAFSLDMEIVETVAHMRSAVTEYGNVDIICDVGGQDIKVLFMKHGNVVDFKLNTQCSAGNGYFLQNMAQQFGIPIEEFADHAFKVRKAPSFNYGCAVFMEQDKVNFQQLGWSKEEIMAGLALVLPLNIWNYVVQEPNMGRLGSRIVLQGGTQKNLAAVKAQVDYIKDRVPEAEVFVHKHADICGAVGAAIEAEAGLDSGGSVFPGVENASNIEFKTQNDEITRCIFCVNHCPRTFIDVSLPPDISVRHIAGYGCDKGRYETRSEMEKQTKEKREKRREVPNLVKDASEIVFDEYDFNPLPEGSRRSGTGNPSGKERSEMVIGIPRVLNMYLYSPFFSTYFRSLGVKDVVYSDYTSSKLWAEGNQWGSIDPCFPAKVAPAHVYQLLKRDDITAVCFPIITHLQSAVDNTLGNNACVIQMGTPEVVESAFTKDRNFFRERGVDYWKPLVALDNELQTKGRMYKYFNEILSLTKEENSHAVDQGFAAMERYLERLRDKGRVVINSLIENDSIGILFIGHPYHHDPGLNHGILSELQDRGIPILCIESLPVDKEFLGPLFSGSEAEDSAGHLDIKDIWIRNFNRNTNLKVWAAKVAARHPNLAVVDLSSFKCGHDAPTYSYIDNVLDASETPHFLFHDLDQNRPGATLDIRIKTIDYFLRKEERRLKERVKG